jgi:hypothetical protein
MNSRRLFTTAILAVALAALGAKKTPTAPGKYQEWDPTLTRSRS